MKPIEIEQELDGLQRDLLDLERGALKKLLAAMCDHIIALSKELDELKKLPL